MIEVMRLTDTDEITLMTRIASRLGNRILPHLFGEYIIDLRIKIVGNRTSTAKSISGACISGACVWSNIAFRLTGWRVGLVFFPL
jgi:hypothetical protein